MMRNTYTITATVKMVLVLFFVVMFTFDAVSDPLPSGKELLALIDATKEQINTYESIVNATAFGFKNGKQSDTPINSNTIRTLSSRNRCYTEIKDTEFNKQIGPRLFEKYSTTKTVVNTPKWSKSLIQQQESDLPLGIISPDEIIEAKKPFSPVFVMHQVHELYASVLEQCELRVTQNDEGYYVLENIAPEGQFSISIVVNPEKGYCPVRSQVLLPDGTLFMKQIGCDFKQVSPGVWLPSSFTNEVHAKGFESLGIDGYISKYQVTLLTVNKPLEDEAIDFTFPVGTKVEDKSAGIDYILTLHAKDQNIDHSNEATVDEFLNRPPGERLIHATSQAGVRVLRIHPLLATQALICTYWAYILVFLSLCAGGYYVRTYRRVRCNSNLCSNPKPVDESPIL